MSAEVEGNVYWRHLKLNQTCYRVWEKDGEFFAREVGLGRTLRVIWDSESEKEAKEFLYSIAQPESGKLKALDLVQSAYGGGYPIANPVAHRLGIEHGTPLVVVDKRDLVKLLREVESACLYTLGTMEVETNYTPNTEPKVAIHRGRATSSVRQLRLLLEKVEPLLKEWGTFVF